MALYVDDRSGRPVNSGKCTYIFTLFLMTCYTHNSSWFELVQYVEIRSRSTHSSFYFLYLDMAFHFENASCLRFIYGLRTNIFALFFIECYTRNGSGFHIVQGMCIHSKYAQLNAYFIFLVMAFFVDDGSFLALFEVCATIFSLYYWWQATFTM